MNNKECIFCKIANNEIPSKKIFENENVVAFLDINPISDGHTVIINKTHSKDLASSNDKQLINTILAIKEVSNLLSKTLNVNDFNYLSNQGELAGQVIDHWHFHVIPKYEKNKGFVTNNKIEVSDIETIFKKINGC